MKVLITGVKGQLGYAIAKHCIQCGYDYLGVDRDECDITDEAKVKSVISDYHPDIIVHCAAYTAVDKAESDKELCYKINVLGTMYIAQACKSIDAKLVYFSTDYVFSGEGTEFYKPDDIDRIHPQNEYGLTKHKSEQIVADQLSKYFILRISWLFGNGNNFIKTMLKLSQTHEEIRVVDDQIGSPTYTEDLAALVMKMMLTDKYGIYHATNENVCSWAEFAQEIFSMAKAKTRVIPVTTKQYGESAAKRPNNSRLDKHKLIDSGFELLPTWQDALQRYLIELSDSKGI